jgi:hypothetical protein
LTGAAETGVKNAAMVSAKVRNAVNDFMVMVDKFVEEMGGSDRRARSEDCVMGKVEKTAR